MTKLLISTQVYENYGAHDWDGEGECPHSWRAKGGNDYVVKNVDECDMIEVIVDRYRTQIETDTIGYTETIIGYRVVPDDYLTDFEQSQLEYDGKITYPAKVLA